MVESIWKRPGWITAMVGVVSVFLTVPDIIGNYFTKQQDIELAKEQTAAVRLGNIESKLDQEFRIVHNTLSQQGSERVFILRYLAKTLDDPDAKKWAHEEVKRLDDIASTQEQLNKAQLQLDEKQKELNTRIKMGEVSNKLLEEEINTLQKTLMTKESEVTELREKAGLKNEHSFKSLFYYKVEANWDEIQNIEKIKVSWTGLNGYTWCNRNNLCENVVVGTSPETLTFSPAKMINAIRVSELKPRTPLGYHPVMPYKLYPVNYKCEIKGTEYVCLKQFQ